jgi:hypothetical protein
MISNVSRISVRRPLPYTSCRKVLRCLGGHVHCPLHAGPGSRPCQLTAPVACSGQAAHPRSAWPQVLPLQLPSLDVDVRAAPVPPYVQAYLAGLTFALAASPCRWEAAAWLAAAVHALVVQSNTTCGAVGHCMWCWQSLHLLPCRACSCSMPGSTMASQMQVTYVPVCSTFYSNPVCSFASMLPCGIMRLLHL